MLGCPQTSSYGVAALQPWPSVGLIILLSFEWIVAVRLQSCIEAVHKLTFVLRAVRPGDPALIADLWADVGVILLGWRFIVSLGTVGLYPPPV